MRWPEVTAGPVHIWSPRLLPGVEACFVLMGTSERLPTRTTGVVWSGTIRKSSMKSVWRVDWIFPYRMYIDSNCCNSQI
jgi:hypothetical protein